MQSITRSTPIMNLRSSVGHIHYFYKDLALCALRDCGYEIVDLAYTASRIEALGLSLRARLMAYPRRLFFRLHQDLAVRLLGGYSLLVLALWHRGAGWGGSRRRERRLPPADRAAERACPRQRPMARAGG